MKLLIYTGLVLIIIISLTGMNVVRVLHKEKPVDENRTVYVEKTESGFQLIRNGEPFHIQGAGGDSHFKELAEIGGNTIRVFNSSDLKAKLDEAHNYGLAVIVDIYIPPYSTSYNLYADEDENVLLKQDVRDLVYQYKDHPALLIWNLGNELNYPLVFRKNDFIRTFNELVSIIQEVDPDHPVSTSIIGAGRKTMSSIYIHSPDLDIVSFNTFGNTKFVNSHLAQVSLLFGSRPYLFSELGPDGPWEIQTTSWGAPIEPVSSIKSDSYKSRSGMFLGNEDSASLGTLFFYWGTKLERTHTWFSLFRDGEKSESINAIKSLWSESNITPQMSDMKYMTVNSKRAYENIIFVPGELSQAEIVFDNNYSDSLRIDWEIYPEAWFSDRDEIVVSNYKPIDTFNSFDKNETTFRAPLKEGPYRIFAYIYNHDGTYATTNTPFYVLNNQ
ncbi:MAG: hypothetical protein JJU37_06475 [Balneolaceae bacterium]|nr:hypothetical protein [Balneolaceae bacterium]